MPRHQEEREEQGGHHDDRDGGDGDDEEQGGQHHHDDGEWCQKYICPPRSASYQSIAEIDDTKNMVLNISWEWLGGSWEIC